MRTLLHVIVAATICLFGVNAEAMDLVRDGKAVSTIVVPDQATETEQGAANRLVKYLKMASGAELPIVKESAVQALAKPGGKTLISVGKTDLAGQAGVTDKGLKYDGYRLVVKGKTLYLLGRDTNMIEAQRIFKAPLMGGAQGSIRAALGLLDRLGFRWLQPTPMGLHVPELKTVSVPSDLNVTYEAPFMYMQGRMYNCGDWSMANSFRVSIKAYGRGGHTWPAALPESLFKKHPECFVMKDGKRYLDPKLPQYCSSSPETRRRVAAWTMNILKQGHEMVQLAQQDGFVPCECELCAKLSPGDQVHEANRKIIKMIGENYPDRVVQLLIYGPTSETPTTPFKPYPSNTVAEVTLMGSSHEVDQRLEHWAKAAGGLTVYAYEMGPYWNDGLAPRFYPERAAAKIKNWIAHKVKGIYWCGGGENWGAVGPTYYVIGRLATDPTLGWREVYKEYLNLTFRKAAPAMKQYYDALYKRLAQFRDPKNDTMLVGIKDGKRLNYKHAYPHEMWTTIYPIETLIELQSYLDKARKQAGNDEKAQGWIRVAQISYDQYALIARMFHETMKFRGKGPKPKSKELLRKSAESYYAWVDQTLRLKATDPEFRKNYFPACAKHGDIWSDDKFLRYNNGRMHPLWFEHP